jgi:hypothetical protein
LDRADSPRRLAHGRLNQERIPDPHIPGFGVSRSGMIRSAGSAGVANKDRHRWPDMAGAASRPDWLAYYPRVHHLGAGQQCAWPRPARPGVCRTPIGGQTPLLQGPRCGDVEAGSVRRSPFSDLALDRNEDNPFRLESGCRRPARSRGSGTSAGSSSRRPDSGCAVGADSEQAIDSSSSRTARLWISIRGIAMAVPMADHGRRARVRYRPRRVVLSSAINRETTP